MDIRLTERQRGPVAAALTLFGALAIMVALFFWGVALGGLMGLILAIPLTAFFVVVWRLLKAKYLRAMG